VSETYQGPNRVFSGVQPTGALHLGNYLGQDPKELANQTRHIAAAFLASGVDPKKAIVYNQSSVRAHTELAWYFNCVARVGWLNRMTQFKDKAGKNSEKMSVGLYDYPVLQAADILAFKGTHVPVGEDQKQHLELSRQIAQKFNHDFGVPDFFPLPEPLIKGPGAKVMSLRDGTKKMSKSDPSDASRLNLTDSADVIAKKIRKAKTDSGAVPETVEELEDRADIAGLVAIYAALADISEAEVLTRHAGGQFGPFKQALADVAVEVLSPITDLMNRYLADPEELDRILSQAGDKAAEIADPIVADVRRVIGFRGA